MPTKEQPQDAASQRVQETFDKEQEQGYRGAKTDPTPDTAYTVQGVTSGAPTPETDPKLAAEAEQRARTLGEDVAHKEAAK